MKMTSIFSCKLPSWLNLPLKRKFVDNESEKETFHQTKKQRIQRPGKENDRRILHDSERVKQTIPKVLPGQAAISERHNLGWFINLPLELMYIIYQLLDIKSLVVLASLSKGFNSSVLQYLLSTPGFVHLVNKKPTNTSLTELKSNPTLFQNAGLALGNITVCHSVTKRLRIMSKIKEKIEVHSTIITSTGYRCFGQFFSSYVRKWNELDRKKAYCLFVKITKLEQKIQRILRFFPGTLPWHERELRELVLQTLLLSHIPEEEYGFWLTLILRPLPITHQARLLYILTGPTDLSGTICWYCTCGCIESGTRRWQLYNDDLYDMSDIARAFRILLTNCQHDWTLDATISVFNELTMMPCGWCLEKVASLLVKSGDALSKAVMGNRALNGHTEELSLMLYHIAHCCFNPRIISMAASVSVGYNGKDMTTLSDWYIDLLMFTIKQVADKKAKKKLTTSLFTSWHDCCSILFNEHLTNTDIEFHESCALNSLKTLTNISKVILDRLLEVTSTDMK